MKKSINNYNLSVGSDESTAISSGADAKPFVSSIAGTRRYMAPEWSQLCEDHACQEEDPTQALQRLDIYAMGIILADLICNPSTGMETMQIEDCLKPRPGKKPTLPKGYKLEGLPEGDLLLALVNPDS